MNSWDKYDLDTLGDIFFNSTLSFNKESLIVLFDKSSDDLRQKITEFKKQVKIAKLNGWKEIEEIWRVGGFILLISIDLKIT